MLLPCKVPPFLPSSGISTTGHKSEGQIKQHLLTSDYHVTLHIVHHRNSRIHDELVCYSFV